MRISPVSSNKSIFPIKQIGKTTISPTFMANYSKVPKCDYAQFYRNMPDLNGIKYLGIQNFRIVNPTCASGSTFADKTKYLPKLRELGIRTIIDFRGEANTTFEKDCHKNGLNYFNFNLNNVANLTNPDYFIRKKNNKFKVTDKFVDNLKQFFSLVNDGNVYMGCQYGIDRTNIALILNYLLNPVEETAPNILTWPYDPKKTVANKNIKAVKKIFKHLDNEQKSMLGIYGNYTEILKERIFTLLYKNHLLQISQIV